jgi:hypothetical protein
LEGFETSEKSRLAVVNYRLVARAEDKDWGKNTTKYRLEHPIKTVQISTPGLQNWKGISNGWGCKNTHTCQVQINSELT